MSNLSLSLNVTVTGAAGRIAYSLFPFLCDGRTFGKSTTINLKLLDVPTCQSKMDGVKMEILDSGFDNLGEIYCTTDPDEAFRDADVVILLGGFPRLPGMERRDLISKNVDIMRVQASCIERLASRNVKVIVVANPANTNCLVCMSLAKSIPRQNFSCLTRLDHERLRSSIREKINSSRDILNKISISDVKDVAIFGNHSVTQTPFTGSSKVMLDGDWQKADNIITESQWYLSELVPKVQNRGGAILKAQQASSAMSAASAISKHLRDWIGPITVEGSCCQDNQIVSMGVLSDGNPYGVPNGLICSFPLQRVFDSDGNSSMIFVPNLVINQQVRNMINASVAELLDEVTDAESILGFRIQTIESNL